MCVFFSFGDVRILTYILQGKIPSRFSNSEEWVLIAHWCWNTVDDFCHSVMFHHSELLIRNCENGRNPPPYIFSLAQCPSLFCLWDQKSHNKALNMCRRGFKEINDRNRPPYVWPSIINGLSKWKHIPFYFSSFYGNRNHTKSGKKCAAVALHNYI